MANSSLFAAVPRVPRDAFLDMQARLMSDTCPDKIDLGGGVYRDERGAYFELPVIKQAKAILESQNLGHDYLVATGHAQFLKGAQALIFGADSEATASQRIASVQTVSGTGANHIGAVFARRFLSGSKASPAVYIGTPAWVNYVPLFKHAGFRTVEYAYYDSERKVVDFEAVMAAVRTAERGSVFVLQACCHNPTGVDLSREQWIELAKAFKAFGQFPFIDVAYQGFGQGFEEDAFGVRHFVEMGFEVIVCQSFSKNMGLYSERVGALHVVVNQRSVALSVTDQLRSLVRWEFSNPPAYGARLASIIMASEKLNEQWREEVSSMRTRLQTNRIVLHNCLTKILKTPGNWDHTLHEKGLFSFLTLSKSQVERLITEFHIYLLNSGRINVAGLNPRSLEVVSRAIDIVVRDDLEKSHEPIRTNAAHRASQAVMAVG